MLQDKCLAMSLGMWKMRPIRMRVYALTKNRSVFSTKLLLKLQQKSQQHEHNSNELDS